MDFPRVSGVLLHPTSLPGRFGIGDLGPEAYRFADFLALTAQGIWQVLPLGPTGYGDSPYQCFSAFAGNPLLVSIDRLIESGDLRAADATANLPAFPADSVDFGRVIQYRLPLLTRAAENFFAKSAPARHEAFDEFCRESAAWLEDYALFIALKEAHGGVVVWNRWPKEISTRRPEALARAKKRLAGEIAIQKYVQFQFSQQWSELKTYCHAKCIRLMGDIPIFVAHDSADVWASPELFRLNPDGSLKAQAGVPPDYFSATGQLWGNPVYRWDVMAKQGYTWWIERFRAALRLVDIIRLDHFRGFEAYWEVPAGDTTAINGQWLKGPGADLFVAVQKALGDIPIVAETLGVITPEVVELRDRFGYPGMGILQFAFGNDAQSPDFRPHNFRHNFVVYTGTHDNDTTMGWWTSEGKGDSTRTEDDIRREKDFALNYLGTNGKEMNWVMIRTILASVADMAITPCKTFWVWEATRE